MDRRSPARTHVVLLAIACALVAGCTAPVRISVEVEGYEGPPEPPDGGVRFESPLVLALDPGGPNDETMSVDRDGTHTFFRRVFPGAVLALEVAQQPIAPVQRCEPSADTVTAGGARVTVTCRRGP